MTVFLTGASSGIGLGLLTYFLEAGHTVLAASRREPVLPKALSTAPGFRFASIDLSGPASDIESGLALLLKGHTSIDLAVLNAGRLGKIEDMAEAGLDDLQLTMQVNVWSNKTLLDGLFAHVSAVRQVVAISSGAAVSGARGWSGYGISKAALNMLIALYAAERPQTHFCALAPGLVESAMQDRIAGGEFDAQKFPVVQRLLAARGTPDMPGPQQVAPRLVQAFEKVLSLKSGSFADIRKL